MDAFGKSTGRLPSGSFSTLAATKASPPAFLKASLAGTNNRGGTSQASAGATGAFADGCQSGDKISTATVAAPKQVPAVTAT